MFHINLILEYDHYGKNNLLLIRLSLFTKFIHHSQPNDQAVLDMQEISDGMFRSGAANGPESAETSYYLGYKWPKLVGAI